MKVMLADFYHLHQVASLMQAHRHEVPVTLGLVFDYEECMEGLIHAIGKDSTNLLFVACDGAEVIGYLMLCVIKPHFCKQLFLNEQYLYITPPRRRGRTMLKLLNKAKEVGVALGCEFLQVGITSGLPELERMYDKRYERVGSIYRINLGE